MPTVRKLSPEEIQTLERKGKGTRRLVEEQYDAYLREYMPGEYGEAIPDENEQKATVRNRLKAAAARQGLTLIFQRTRDNRLRFKVDAAHDGQETHEEPREQTIEELLPQPESVPEASAPQPKKGRRKSQTASVGD